MLCFLPVFKKYLLILIILFEMLLIIWPRLFFFSNQLLFWQAEFLDEIQTNVLRVFLLAIHIHISFALRFLFRQTYARNLLQFLLHTVKEKGGKPDRKPYPIPHG